MAANLKPTVELSCVEGSAAACRKQMNACTSISKGDIPAYDGILKRRLPFLEGHE